MLCNGLDVQVPQVLQLQ